MIELQSSGWYNVTGRGWVAAIDNSDNQLPEEVALRDLLHATVKIDDKEYYIHGVETQGYSRRYFALLVGRNK